MLQATLAFSTIKVEYMSIIEVVKEAIWLRGLFEELVNKHDATIDQMHHERIEHIDIRYHFVCEVVA
ncbi:Retrovirus-related Pol polyprotein from transposon TNT 1-94 [Gossypium australe]|uniref:Retrovirus-related Pol polyprotein from transposon TNT 1-94 n=1 Tax=Gossypium australe TaxID=47621 RepID=A0A5B6WUQ1_9ROSI|nr:Retrovirus-related Pol polyprotein from transposon TNT 1-94 [Gossypium australe]